MSSFQEIFQKDISAFLARVRLPEREGRQPELKMSSFKKRVNWKCQHVWLGSGSRRQPELNMSSVKDKLIGKVSISGSGPASGKGGKAAGADYENF